MSMDEAIQKMTPNEIVKELRDSLPPQIDYAELVGSPVPSSYGKCFVWDNPVPYMVERAADMIEQLEQQLAESQHREQAAVEDAKQGSVCRTCHYLNNGCEPLNLDAGCHKWQWRGPQEAGEGEAE